eukprot:891973-Amphidinium_carterae.1
MAASNDNGTLYPRSSQRFYHELIVGFLGMHQVSWLIIVYDILGVLLFSCFIVYDTQMILGTSSSKNTVSTVDTSSNFALMIIVWQLFSSTWISSICFCCCWSYLVVADSEAASELTDERAQH